MRRSDQRREAVFASYQRDVTGRPLEELIAESRPLTREIAEGVDYHREELDDEIADHAKGWAVERLAPLADAPRFINGILGAIVRERGGVK